MSLRGWGRGTPNLFGGARDADTRGPQPAGGRPTPVGSAAPAAPDRRPALTPRPTRYAVAALLGAAGAIPLVLFPDFFGRTPFLAAWSVAIVSLAFLGVGPAIVAQAVILSATLGLILRPGRLQAELVGSDLIRLAIMALALALADLLAWRAERTQRSAAERERALRDSEARYRHILEQASDGIVMVRPGGELALANERICEMMGYTRGELARLAPAEWFAAGTPADWAELARSPLTLREQSLRRKDGSTFIAELSVRRAADGMTQAIVRDITERRRAEEVLRSERDLLDGILATSVAGIMVVNPEGRVIFLNARAESALGVTKAQLADRTDLPPGWRLLNLEGKVVAREERPVARVVAGGEPVQDARMLLERPDGERRILSINAAPLRGPDGRITAVVLSLSDITLHSRVQEQLRRITSAVPGVVYQLVAGPGPSGRFTYVSERAGELLGVEASEIVADAAGGIATIHPDDREEMLERFRDANVSLEPRSFDFRVRLRDGQTRWLRDIATALRGRDPDRVIWTGVIVDITEQKRLAEELQQAQKMDSLGRLAGGVAHDFNNLLTVIRGYADVLAGEFSLGDPRAAEIQEIRSAADRAGSLTRQLLAVSRRQVLVPREVDLNTLVREMERMLRRVIGENITIVTVPAPDLGSVRADPGQLEQVILNLAVNARDAMPAGGTLRIETRRIRLESGHEAAGARGVPPGDYAVLTVADTGFGMDEDTLGRIFEPFFTTKPAGEGTGLGLSTVYGIVQQSRGTITVESAPGRGTSFRIFLPRLPSLELALPAGAAAPTSWPAPRSRASVLLVEDDEGVRQLVLRVLEQYGYSVIQAENGREAVELLRSLGRTVEAVITDVVMPYMNGPEMIRRLRESQPDLPVLYLSGYTGGEEAQQDLGPGWKQSFLQKPFSPDALAAALEDLLADSAPPSGRATAG